MRVSESTYDIARRRLLLRVPEEADAEIMIEGLRTVCGETDFLLRGAEEVNMSGEDERAFINAMNRSEHDLMLLGFLDGEYAGCCSFSGNGLFRLRHRAALGIALMQRFTGLGIGRIMLERLASEAKGAGIEQLELEVDAANTRAIELYKRLGFGTFGRLPDNMKYADGRYSDSLWMMKKI